MQSIATAGVYKVQLLRPALEFYFFDLDSQTLLSIGIINLTVDNGLIFRACCSIPIIYEQIQVTFRGDDITTNHHHY